MIGYLTYQMRYNQLIMMIFLIALIILFGISI